MDDAEHVLFRCPRWAVERAELEAELGDEFRLENRVLKRLAAKDGLWNKFYNFCTEAMQCLLQKEREVVASLRMERRRTATI